ncbi:MAG: 3-oxoacyl-ACP reductase family protein [Planctomycetota bacterium]|jgi:3-oxoacyl-[acyl-carrier protein] reductase
MFDLKGRVALVTGSSTGLGKAMAHHLGRAGAKVALNYANNEARAAETLEQFRAEGLEGDMFKCDVTDPDSVEAMVADIEANLGPVDIVVLNATPDQPQMPIEEYDWAFHQSMLDFFVKSPFLITRAVLPGMKERRRGRIINIGSEVFDRGVPNFSPYVAAKGAQRGWTRSMSQELARWGITVNMISPGWIPVERHEKDPQEMKDGYRVLIPMNRWGKPEDIGAAAVYFASDEAGFVTGQTLVVNGGMTVS